MVSFKSIDDVVSEVNKKLYHFGYYFTEGYHLINDISVIEHAIQIFEEFGVHTFYPDLSGSSVFVSFDGENYFIQYNCDCGLEIVEKVGRLDELY